MLVKSRVLRGNYDWHDILRRDCAQEIKRCKKPGLPERVRTNTQAVLLLAWGGLAKGNQSVQQAKARVDFLVGTWRKEISRCNKPGLRGLGPGLPKAWGPGLEGRSLQGLCRGLGFRARTIATPEFKSRVLRGNYDWHDILRRDCAQEIKRCKKPHFPARCNKARQASGKSKSVGVISQGLGPGPPGAWGPGRGASPVFSW